MKSVSDVPPTAGMGKTLTDRLARWIVPWAYFVGILAGFVACILAGYLSTRQTMFGSFTRFHQGISSETLFFPTALEMQRLAETLPPEKINVIIGGSSRFNGVGQTESQLWAHELQRRLGPGYAVIDLALRGGGIDQFGMHVAEMMLKERRKVIFLADAFAASRLRPDGTLKDYRYFFFDAAAHGLLIDPAERLAAAEADALATGTLLQVREWERRASANAAFHVDDLWTWFGYQIAYLPAWTQMTAPRPFWPRRKFVDNEPPTPPGGYYDRMGAAAKDRFRFDASWVDPSALHLVGESYKWLPERLRMHTIVAEIRNAPRYVDAFGAADRASYEQAYRGFPQEMARVGIRAVELGRDWTDDDFSDGLHMSAPGGAKAAATLAPEVEALAARLGYLR